MSTTTKAPMIDQGFAAQGIRQQKRKTHCSRGHARTPDNLGPGKECLTCKRAWADVKREARAAERAHELAVAGIRHEHTLAGLRSFLRRREERGVPAGGWQVAE